MIYGMTSQEAMFVVIEAWKSGELGFHPSICNEEILKITSAFDTLAESSIIDRS